MRVSRAVRFLTVTAIIGSSSVIASIPASASGPTCEQLPYQSLNCLHQSVKPTGITDLIGDCHSAPAPQMPGSGLSGTIDPGKTNPDLTETLPATTNPGEIPDVYGTVSYPPPWHTYDIGCAGAFGDTWSATDTAVGNALKGIATTIVAFGNSIHRFVSPPNFMSHFDAVLQTASSAMRDALFSPYIGLALLLIGVGLIIAARRRQIPKAVEQIVWALAVITVATALWTWPVRAGHMADSAATAVIGKIGSTFNPGSGGDDPSAARAGLIVNNVLYKEWLQGELGSSDSATALKYGVRLLEDQTYSYVEAKDIQKNPADASGIAKKKQADFKKAAGEIRKSDPDAYTHLKGQAGSRIGLGSMSALAAAFVMPFMIVADVLVVIALFIIRLLVIAFPAIALLGVFFQLRVLVLTSFERAFRGVANAVVFASLSAINVTMVGIFFSPSVGLPQWASIMLGGVVTFILWKAAQPFRRLNSMVSPQSVVSGLGDVSTSRHSRMIRKDRRHRKQETGALRDVVGELSDVVGALDRNTSSVDKHAALIEGIAVPEGWSRPDTADSPQEHAQPVYADDMGANHDPGGSSVVDHQLDATIHADTVNASTHVDDDNGPILADPVVDEDGTVAWRIWDPDTRKSGTNEHGDGEQKNA